jgi:CHASE3 domain sensor protein
MTTTNHTSTGFANADHARAIDTPFDGVRGGVLTATDRRELAGEGIPPSNPLPASESRLWQRLSIGRKLGISFGILVALTLLVAGLSFLGSRSAAQGISSTDEVRVPTALLAARAQADLLRMQAATRGYLALGDAEFRESYRREAATFEARLDELLAFAPKLAPADQTNLLLLQSLYGQWKPYPEQLFALRDDQLEREPAYAILATDGLRKGGQVLIDTGKLIDEQGLREATPENQALLAELARFQGSFSAMLSGLRGYVTTRNRTFRGEYIANRDLNELAWDRLTASREAMSPRQQELLDTVGGSREGFLELPDRIFEILESDRWREDLYLFRQQALPISDSMLQALSTLTTNQQNQLRAELDLGRANLTDANRQIAAGGAAAVLLGIVLAYVFRENIAGPVRRLTSVVERISGGELAARAQVESRDEVGLLAGAFNDMAGRLQSTLRQISAEKTRADNLLHVVIPIGVQLAAEKDFDRLLETILVEAKEFCRAEAGNLYLRTADAADQSTEILSYVIVRNDPLGLALGGTTGHSIAYAGIPLAGDSALDQPDSAGSAVVRAAVGGQTVNIALAGNAMGETGTGADDYRPTALLALPLKNSAGEVLGVLQLADPRDARTGEVVPFDANLQQMMESYSSLAVAALEAYIREQGLRQQIQQLKIEIDEAKRQKQVDEIVESNFFQHLQERARAIRSRSRGGAEGAAAAAPDSGAEGDGANKGDAVTKTDAAADPVSSGDA